MLILIVDEHMHSRRLVDHLITLGHTPVMSGDCEMKIVKERCPVDFEELELRYLANRFKALSDNILTAPASRIKKGKGPRDKWGKLK